MTIKKSLSACALAVAVGATSLMAMPGSADAQRIKLETDTNLPKVIPDFQPSSVSSACRYIKSDGERVDGHIDIFTNFNDEALIARAVRIQKNSDAGPDWMVIQVREGLRGSGEVLVGPSGIQLNPSKQQQQANIPRVDIPEGNRLEVFLTENPFVAGSPLCGFQILVTPETVTPVNQP